MSAARRSTKWHPPPPPSPKILHLPRRIRLRSNPPKRPAPSEHRRNLRSLIAEEKMNGADRAGEENSWKIEADMLRAECDFLRMERDAAFQKLEKTRERKKIDGSDGIEKKMGKLKMRSREADEEAHNVREIQDIDESSTLAKHKDEINVEKLKRKMEGISKGMMERMEGYGSLLVSANNNSNNSSVISSYSGKSEIANQWKQVKEVGAMRYKCCCHCREVAGRIAEEVKAETEQWAEMQEMLDQVRIEMEDLKSSRDLWQRRAIASELNLRSLHSHMLEWEQRARASEKEVTELKKHMLQLDKLRAELVSSLTSPSQNAHSDNGDLVRLPRIRCQQLQQRSPDYSAMEKEKHVLVCRLNRSKSNFPRRSALQDIGNLQSPPLPSRMKQGPRLN